jgi:hypothetical protein
LDRVHRERVVSVLIVGRCKGGADKHAEDWAIARGISVDPYPAAWDDVEAPGAVVRYRKGTGEPYNILAGFWRNQEMIDKGKPDAGVGFPGGTGTADMLARCKMAGVKVWRPYG